MDDTAEAGVAAHYRYKEGITDSKPLDELSTWIRSILDTTSSDKLSDFVNDFRLNLFSEEIYVFTPRGKLITLPKGATCIDFAFEIHSEVGERTVGAKVNQHLVPLRQELRTGDQVEIITSKEVTVKQDWLNYVITHKARSRVRAIIKTEEKRIIEQGKELLSKKLGKLQSEITDTLLSRAAQKLKYSTINQLYLDIGNNEVEIVKVIRIIKTLIIEAEQEELDSLELRTDKKIHDQFIDEARSSADSGLILNGDFADIPYTYAKCCNPIPGDEVVGFLSRTGGIRIHRANCSNVPHLQLHESERIVDVNWPQKVNSRFEGAIKIIGRDRQGVVTDITSHISKQLNTNIKSISVGENNGMFEGILILYVTDLKHLKQIMKDLKSIEGVKEVMRFD
jgi:GTP pyrophosphokinase/guanosine-3',5'-bis(diphosphate) 3'-pyrophosphohydrolase